MRKIGIVICMAFLLFNFNVIENVQAENMLYSEGDEIIDSISEDSEVESIHINSNLTVMHIGEVNNITVSHFPENAELKEDIQILSSNPEVIKIDDNGNLVAINVGTSVISAKLGELEDSITVEVLPVENSAPRSVQSGFKTSVDKASIYYKTHVQDIGWQDYVYDGNMSGTSGLSKRLEAIQIALDSSYSGGIKYKTHVQDIGWQDYVYDGNMSGTSGLSKRLEAIQIELTGDIANYYDIYYRVHCEEFGWLGWAKNGEKAGTEGYSYRLEAIEIKLVKKGDNFNVNGPCFYHKMLQYSSHVQDIGWQEYETDGDTSGTSGEEKRIEAVRIKLLDQDYDGSIEYSTHVQDIGWQDYVYDGNMSGTVNESKRIEAIKIKLTGQMADNFDIYYRVHTQEFGWLGWAKNDEKAGTEGYSYRLEAIQILLMKKGDELAQTYPAYYKRYIKYESHVSGLGWQETKGDGETSGTVGQSRGIEAFRAVIEDRTYSGSVRYKTHISNYGWQDFRYDSQISGTTGQSKNIEAIQMELIGDVENYYDIYYRVHSQNFGWLGWAKNGEKAGTTGYGYRIEAIEVKLVKKGEYFDVIGDSYKFTVSGYFEIASKLNENKVFDATGANTKDGTNVFIYSKNDSIAQIWSINDLNNGYFSISSSMNPNVFLTLNNNNLELNRKLESDTQLFSFKEEKDGCINIVSKFNGLYITLSDFNLYDTLNIIASGYNGNDTQKFKLIKYEGLKIYNGLDISAHNGSIDFNALGASTNFVIIRAGYGNDDYSQDDSRYTEYIRNCEAYNIPYGIYIYSYALNTAEATSEAYHALRLLRETGSNFKLGVWFDMEDADNYKLRRGITTSNGQLLSDICDTFGSIIQNNGYQVGIYASLSWLNGPLNDPRLDKYQKWVAQWNGPVTYSEAINHSSSYNKPYKLWQFCSDGHIAGVGGGVSNVDLDLGYNIFE